MRKIGLMGGTFNPVHNAHLIMAEYAREQLGLDFVIFMTGGNPPHKRDMKMPSASVRHEMLKMSVCGVDYFTADDYEVKLDEYSYSVNTLKHLNEEYPDDEIYFIIGYDSLRDFEKWYKPDEIMHLCSLVVYPRGENMPLKEKAEEIMQKYGGRIYCIDAPVIGISSTQIRERIAQGKSVRYMIPKKVLQYIEANGLYR